MIPNGTKVRVKNTFNDRALEHVNGFEGEVVKSYFLPSNLGLGDSARRYLVCVNGLDYDLSKEELEIV